jgi:hypothetical protein
MKKKNAVKFAAIATAYQRSEAFSPLVITSILPFAVRISMLPRKKADTVSFLESREKRTNPRTLIVKLPRCQYCDNTDGKEHEIDLFGYDDFFGHFPGTSSHEYVLSK